LGYVIMRLAMVSLWLRAAAGDEPRRRTCLSYAGGIAVLQVGWLLWLLVPIGLKVPGFLLLMVLELMLPMWAERSGATPWHPHHIAERYGLLTIIVLGEVILAIFLAFQATSDAGDRTSDLVVTGVAGVVIVCSMWWLYFSKPAATTVTTARVAFESGSTRRTFLWGYGHYFIFASAAAVGAGLAAAVDLAGTDGRTRALAVAIPAALFVLVVSLLPGLTSARVQILAGAISATALIVAAGVGAPLILVALVIPLQLIALTVAGRASSAT
jgi:low temperature requirement protein LtrA